VARSTFIHFDKSDTNVAFDLRVSAIDAVVDKGEDGTVLYVGGTRFVTDERYQHVVHRIERADR
jgi:hypothetical protein